MPVISSFSQTPLWLPDRHSQTIFPALFRRVSGVAYQRERIVTSDNDFLDLDWSCKGSSKIAIISHGMEGRTSRPYMQGMVKKLNENEWDALCWNLRGCSGDINTQMGLYHAGSTNDLICVIDHVRKTQKYAEIVLIGFSLGGNIILKYLGDLGSQVPVDISKAVVFCVPCDLYPCLQELTKGFNRVYLNMFLISLKQKILEKGKKYPELVHNMDWSKIQNLIDFDNHFTAPLAGFRDARHYYTECSSRHSIPEIQRPALILNPLNDPFLNPDCFPIKECSDNSKVFLELPKNGGHIGFVQNSINGLYLSEERTMQFLRA